MNLPNKLTVLRMLCTPVLVVLFCLKLYIPSMILFVLASLTDVLDGHIARKNNIVTDFGKLFDPLADKLINVTALVLITAQVMVDMPKWYAILVLVSTLVIVAREMLILGFRAFAASEGIVIAADILGKIKTVVQDIAIVLLLIDLSPILNGTFAAAIIHAAAIVITVGALGLTIASGINYFVANKKLTEKISKDV